MSSEVACQAVVLCEGLETSVDVSNQKYLEIPRLRSESQTTESAAQLAAGEVVSQQGR
jgi:hypothetical protein